VYNEVIERRDRWKRVWEESTVWVGPCLSETNVKIPRMRLTQEDRLKPSAHRHQALKLMLSSDKQVQGLQRLHLFGREKKS